MTAGTLAGVVAASLVGVSGDPVVVNTLASHFESVAASIRGAASRLRSLETGSTSSDAVDAFLVKAEQVSSSLRKADERYGETGAALKVNASELSLAQEGAAPALANHRDAVDDLGAAEKLVERYEHFALVATDEVAKQDHLEQATAQRSKADDARGRVALDARRLTDAHASVEAAATTAIAKIDDATDDGLADTLWDDLGGAWDAGFAAFQQWMEENDSWINSLLDVLTVVGVALAAIALLIPGINILAVVVFVASFAIAAARATAGTGSWADVALAGLSVVTMGLGGLAVGSARGMIAGIARTRANHLVSQGYSKGLAFGSVSRSWQRARPGLRDWSLVKGLGDADIARMLHFLRASRPGALADEASEVSRAMLRLNVARGLQSFDHLRGLTDMALLGKRQMSERGGPQGAWRTSTGAQF